MSSRRKKTTVMAGGLAAFLAGLSPRPTQGQVVALNVRIDDTIREPLALRADATVAANDNLETKLLTKVPAGKVLVVENVTITSDVSLSSAAIIGRVNAGEFFHYLERPGGSTRALRSDSRLYVGPGEELNAVITFTPHQFSESVIFSVTGYYAPAIQPGHSALRSDVNHDGKTDISDAVAVLRRIVGLA